MRLKIINFLKLHPKLLDWVWKKARLFFSFLSLFVCVNDKQMIFASYGGRKFDDSPKELYEEVMSRPFFDDWDLVWAFVNPDDFNPPRGRKVKIDTLSFFKTLLSSKVWISNSGMDRDIHIRTKKVLKVETWHGTPLKKIGGEENTGSMIVKHKKYDIDHNTIRCAQSEFDLEIFARVFHADKNAFILSDLPRNDILAKGGSIEKINELKYDIGVPLDKKIILYMPTYREYSLDENMDVYIRPPIDLAKWRAQLEKKYVLLVRAHYAVTKSLEIENDGFAFDVSYYSCINDLYLISDIMISDYSSSYIDYSILNKPMLCFAYDLDEYTRKRGLYLDLKETLPCPVDATEDEVINHVLAMNEQDYIEKSRAFHQRFAPYAGDSSKKVVDKIIDCLCITQKSK